MVVEMVQNSTFWNFIHIQHLFIHIHHIFIYIHHLFIHIQHLFIHIQHLFIHIQHLFIRIQHLFIHIQHLFIHIQHLFIHIQDLFIHIQRLCVFSISIYSSSTFMLSKLHLHWTIIFILNVTYLFLILSIQTFLSIQQFLFIQDLLRISLTHGSNALPVAYEPGQCRRVGILKKIPSIRFKFQPWLLFKNIHISRKIKVCLRYRCEGEFSAMEFMIFKTSFQLRFEYGKSWWCAWIKKSVKPKDTGGGGGGVSHEVFGW